MRTLLVSLTLLGIACNEIESNIPDSNAECIVKYEENWISVNRPELEKAVTRTMTDELGCKTVVTTYYTMVNPTIGANSGGLPLGYYEQQCQWDACDGPMNLANNTATNPTPTDNSN